MKSSTPTVPGEGAGQVDSPDAARILLDVPEALRPLLPELYSALREELAATDAAQGRDDGEGVRQAAHRLKGAAMRFGLAKLSLEAARAEDEAGKGNREEASQALTKFEWLLTQLESGV